MSDDEMAETPSTCLACPPDCRECSKDESDCECYTHQDCHPDDQPQPSAADQ